jgi:hypothetical protein
MGGFELKGARFGIGARSGEILFVGDLPEPVDGFAVEGLMDGDPPSPNELPAIARPMADVMAGRLARQVRTADLATAAKDVDPP